MTTIHTRSIAMMIALGMIAMPASAFASVKPACSLTVTTEQGSTTVTKEETVSLVKGTDLTIEWKGKNAKKMVDGNGTTLELFGSATHAPTTTTEYEFVATNGSKRATCIVRAVAVEGGFTTSTLSATNGKPTISGTLSGTKSGQVIITKEGSSKVLFKKSVRPKSGKWSIKVSKSLPVGSYKIQLLGPKDAELNHIAASTLTIGKKGSATAASTFNVSLIPLLSGGTAHSGNTIPVSYLQIVNTGKETAALKGFWLKQSGSASTNSVLSLTTVDDKGGARGASEMLPFKNGMALAPTDTMLAAGERRLFTIKAVLSGNLAPYNGSTLLLDVTGIEAAASITGAFPIRGTAWTLTP